MHHNNLNLILKSVGLMGGGLCCAAAQAEFLKDSKADL